MRRRPGRRRNGSRCAARPQADEDEELEHDRSPEPKTKAAAVAPQGRRERDASPSAAREQVHGCREERKAHRHQHQLDCPAANEPRAEVDVRRRSLGEFHALVERTEQVFGGPAELAEPVGVEPGSRVLGRDRAAVAGARDRDRRDST